MAKTKVLCIGKKDRGMEREEKMEESIEKKWKRILSPFRRWCSDCNSFFYCTGDCPENRWGGSTRDQSSNGACFCKKCIYETSFDSKYKEARLTNCY